MLVGEVLASMVLVKGRGKSFMPGVYHITCKALFKDLINVCVLSAIEYSVARISDPSL